MRVFLIVLAFLLINFNFGSVQSFAQNKSKVKEAIILELTVGEREDSGPKIEVPINKGTARAKEKPLKPAWSKDGDGSLPPQYSYDLAAYSVDKNNSKVYFRAIVERCEKPVRKEFVVSKRQETELELDCGIKIKAYYGLESKEERILFKLPKRKN